MPISSSPLKDRVTFQYGNKEGTVAVAYPPRINPTPERCCYGRPSWGTVTKTCLLDVLPALSVDVIVMV